MNRREALSAVSFLLGGSIIGADAFLSGCTSPKSGQTDTLTDTDLAFLDEVGETILPATASSPGARQAKVGQFMKVIVMDCYTTSEQQTFISGIGKLNEVSQSKYSKGFLELAPDERHVLLVALDAEAKNYKENRKDGDPEDHYFTMIKQLTLWGYFTSEEGMTQAARHVAVPGRYDACITLEPGQKAWV